MRFASLVLACQAALLAQLSISIPVRDGISLAADLYNADASVKRPVLLMRTPYNKSTVKTTASRFAGAGYTVVVQDVRGRYASPGTSLPYNNEGQDGYDTLEWITRQPWCDGRVGMWGSSHVGAVQWQAAAEGAPGLAVLCPTTTWSSFYRNIYHGGAARLALISQAAAGRSPAPAGKTLPTPAEWSNILLHLPLADMDTTIGWPIPWLRGILTHPKPDGFWKRLDLTRELEQVSIPAQHVVGYYDFFVRETVRNYQRALGNSQDQQLILGPWDHGTIGKTKVADVDFGREAQMDLPGENLAWFNRHLLRTVTTPFAPVRYFSMGDNHWFEAQSWPPADAKPVWFYLHSSGKANTRRGDGRLDRKAPKDVELPDAFQSDPEVPAPAVPQTAGRAKYTGIWGPVDQSPTEDRQDVLVYDSGELTHPLAIAGPVSAELWVKADTPDADWVVKLIDVRPDGFAQNLAVGILRSAFRESEVKTTPLEPGKTYKLNIDLAHTAARLDAGHRLRVEVTGSYFPLYDRNTNTGEGPFSSRTMVSKQQVLHSKDTPSRLQLYLANRQAHNE